VPFKEVMIVLKIAWGHHGSWVINIFTHIYLTEKWDLRLWVQSLAIPTILQPQIVNKDPARLWPGYFFDPTRWDFIWSKGKKWNSGTFGEDFPDLEVADPDPSLLSSQLNTLFYKIKGPVILYLFRNKTNTY